MKPLTWLLMALLIALPAMVQAQPELRVDRLVAPGSRMGDAFGRAVAISGDTLLVGAPGDDSAGTDAGAVHVFVRRPGGDWELQQTLRPTDLRPGDSFGWAVDIQGPLAVVGIPGDAVPSDARTASPGAGRAIVYRRQSGTWTEMARLAPPRPDAAGFGWGVTLDEGRAIVTAPGRYRLNAFADDDAHGFAFVYRLEPAGWQLEDTWTGPSGIYFGRGVDLDDSIAVSYRFGTQCYGGGVLPRLIRPTSEWICTVHWPSPFSSLDTSLFGFAATIRGNRIVAGTPRGGLPYSGGAWVFEWTTLSLDLKLPASMLAPTIPYGRYGAAVAITPDNDVVLGPANGCTWRFEAQPVGPNLPWAMRARCLDDAAGRPERDVTFPVLVYRKQDGAWSQHLALPVPTGLGAMSGYGSELATDGTFVVVGAPQNDMSPAREITGPGVVFVYDLSTLDSDGDGMPDQWERRFTFDPVDPTDAALDADHDGVSNRDEYYAFSHPRNETAHTLYFAEGATSDFFETQIALANPGATDATVALRFATASGASGGLTLDLPARSRTTVDVNDVPGMQAAEFSTTIESDEGVVADRVMRWDRASRYGSHGETALIAPRSTWYLAEGATHSGFDLFYLLQNPGDSATDVRVTYLRPSGAPLVKTYVLPARSRNTIWVNVERFDGDAGGPPALASAELSAVFESTDSTPFIVERAMYRSVPGGRMFDAGHDAAGIAAPEASWFFAEGATGTMFDLFFLLGNPSEIEAQVVGRYLLPDGTTFQKTYRVAPKSRFTIWADEETFAGVTGRPLADRDAVSATFTVAGVHPGIVAERAMWWPGPTVATWAEAHASAGATTTATRWVAAAGEVRDAPRTDTYYLLANPSLTDAATIRVTLLVDDGTTPTEQTFVVPPSSRFSVDVRARFPAAMGKRFGVLVESIDPTPVAFVTEWAVYNDALGMFWASGANALATPVP